MNINQMIEAKTITDAIKIVLHSENGYRDELIKKVGSEITVDELALLGYISQGTTFENNDAKRTFRKTRKAENYALFFIDELTQEEEKTGLYLDSIGF